MLNIIFYCKWGSSPQNLLDSYKLITKNNSGIYNNFKGTNDINLSDIIVFLEGIPNNFDRKLLDNKIILCFPREPFGKKNWESLNLKHGYTYSNFYHVVTYPQFINKNYDFLNELSYTESKNKLSAIMSNKKHTIDYQIRRNLLINFSNKYPNICDIYGAGWNNELGTSYKGKLDGYHKTPQKNTKTKYQGLIDYKYSLCIENTSKKNYFTEKFTDAILCWCIPIYYGCSNIDEYFPKDCYYYVDITKENCINEIINISNKPITQDNIKALEKARYLILNKYNIWSSIEKCLIENS